MSRRLLFAGTLSLLAACAGESWDTLIQGACAMLSECNPSRLEVDCVSDSTAAYTRVMERCADVEPAMRAYHERAAAAEACDAAGLVAGCDEERDAFERAIAGCPE